MENVVGRDYAMLLIKFVPQPKLECVYLDYLLQKLEADKRL